MTLQERPSARSNLVSIAQYIFKASKLTNYQVISLFISWLRSSTTLLTVNMLNAVKRQRIRSIQELPKLTCLLLALWTWRGRSAMAAYIHALRLRARRHQSSIVLGLGYNNMQLRHPRSRDFAYQALPRPRVQRSSLQSTLAGGEPGDEARGLGAGSPENFEIFML